MFQVLLPKFTYRKEVAHHGVHVTQKLRLRVLHLEDDSRWSLTVKNILELEGKFEVITFEEVGTAKSANLDDFDIFICDGRVNGEDGTVWALELFRQGKKVLILSGDAGRENVPFLQKSPGLRTALPAKIKEL